MIAPLTDAQFKEALPDQFKKSVNPALIASINTKITDPEEMEQFRDNIVGFSTVLKEGKFQLPKFIDAVRYVGFKLAGRTNIDAYSKTFPDKIDRFVSEGVADKDIASYVSAYNSSKLVTLLLEQALIPAWLANRDIFQKAVNEQANLMLYAKSEKVRSDAANSLMTHLKAPETKKVELDISEKPDKSMDALRDAMTEYVLMQKEHIKAGVIDAQKAAHSRISRKASYTDITDV